MFDKLPLELLHYIFEEVGQSAFRNYTSVALVCSRWNRAITPLLRSKIRIIVSGREQLENEIQRLVTSLSRTSSFDSVRSLELRGHLPLPYPLPRRNLADDDILRQTSKPSPDGSYDYSWECQWPDNDEDNNSTVELDPAWMPLAEFVKLLPRLSDILFACRNQFPHCLLKIIHRMKDLRCKINIRYFRSRSLAVDTVHPREAELLSSPCLHTITIQLENAQKSLENRALWYFLKGVAPNLKHVNLYWKRCMSTPDAYAVPYLTYFKSESDHIRKPSALESIKIAGDWILTEDFVQDLNECTDLSALRSLDFRGFLYYAANLQKRAFGRLGRCNLAALSTFSIELVDDKSYRNNRRESTYIAGFLAKKPCLQTLSIKGHFGTAIHSAALISHGAGLRRLSLLPELRCWTNTAEDRFSLGYKEIVGLNVACPLLEDLAIRTPRTQGDQQEVEIYEAIGRFSRIRKLTLMLSAQGPNITRDSQGKFVIPEDASFDTFHQKLCSSFRVESDFNDPPAIFPRYGHVRNFFINSALDERLARSIFKVLLSVRSNSMTFLETLEVYVTGTFSFGEYESHVEDANGLPYSKRGGMNHRFHYLSVIREVFERHFILGRISSDENGDRFIVKELNRRTPKSMGLESFALPPAFDEVFQKLWPSGRNAKEDWYDVWHSFPLQVGGDSRSQ